MKQYPVTKPFFSEEEIKLISDSLESGWVAQGPKVTEFEKKIALHEGVAEGVATTSCTTALHLALVAEGCMKGMDVIAPSFTFVATHNAIVLTGATPIMCDICKDTFNIDVEKLEEIIETKYGFEDGKLVNLQTRNILWGILPVHEFGLCCDILKINEIAGKYGLHVIEDAACALGSRIGDVHQGNFGNTSCISFHPRKSITTGEGGMVLTNDSILADKMRSLRSHAGSVSADARDKGKGYLLPEFNDTGFNYRMTDIQGAMGLAQVKKLDFIIESKRKSVQYYNELIKEEIPELITPVEPEGYFHTYQSYVCRLDLKRLGMDSIEDGHTFRNNLMERLEESGVATRQGTHAVHTLGYYKDRFGYANEDYPNAYECDRLSMTLPLYIGISKEDQKEIVEIICKCLNEMGSDF